MMLPEIENPRKLVLPPVTRQLLQTMFADYRRVIIRQEFPRGLSGGQVLEVQPIKAGGTPELPTVVKLATISLIQKEWQAYQQHIRHRLPNVARITGEPVMLPEIGRGGLRYTLMGSGGTFELISLADQCRRAEVMADDVRLTIERLFRIMRHIWGYSYTDPEFFLTASYDHLLPVNLLIQHQPSSTAQPHFITPATLPPKPIEPGDFVCVSGFELSKVNPDTQTLTLKRPKISPNTPPYLIRCRSSLVENMAAYPVGYIIDSIEGNVIETRISRLQDEVRQALGEGFDQTGQTVPLPAADPVRLPNPLNVLPTVLSEICRANIASVHGDFNLENILIEPETGMISLIDFAEAREDHILHDLLRLETEIMTKLVPEILHRHDLPLISTLTAFYWQLHCTVFHGSSAPPSLPHPALKKPWAMLTTIRQTARQYLFESDDPTEYYRGLFLYLLGALKFKNLNDVPERPLPKQVAFWGAALAYQFLITPQTDPATPPAALADLIESQPQITVKPPLTGNEQEADRVTAEEANQKLATLPLDVIPPPASLPAHSRMPFSRNPLFIGRKADLKTLARALKGGETVAIGQVETAATTGLGGIGKTQLASEFVHRYGQFFAGGVFWLSFADSNAVPAEIAACGGAAALDLRPDFGERPLEEQVRLVLAAWQSPAPRLLVFDNCEDPDLLARWRPSSGGCRILVTSRRADWDAVLGVQTLPLDVLHRVESLALLREHQPDVNDATLNAIAEELGDLPLALHLAGSYLARYQHAVSPARYLEQLRDPTLLQHRSLTRMGISPTGHSQNVRRAIALSYDQLNPDDEIDLMALTMLARAACLAPAEPIPYGLLMLTVDLDEDASNALLQAEDSVLRLIELGLMRRETNDALRLHRLVIAFVRLVAEDEIDVAQEVAGSAVLKEAKRINNTGYPTSLLIWQPHLRVVTNRALKLQGQLGAALCNELGRHLVQIGDYEGAFPYYETALEIRSKNLGEEHPDVAECLNNIGYLLRGQGKFTESKPYLEKSLNIRKKILGEDHQATAESYSELGRWFLEQGDPHAARDLLEQAVRISTKILGEKHRFTANCFNKLGLCLDALGDKTGAMQYFEQALVIRQQVLGKEHPRTALSLNNMGYLLRAMDRLTEAQPYYEEALAIRLKIYGEEHPDTAESLNNLGELLRAQGNLTEGRLYLERALAVYMKVWGESHPDTAYPINTLGLLLQDLGDYDEAHNYLERALSIRQQVLPEDHPLTAVSYNNLGLQEQAQGDLSEAQTNLEHALAIRQKVFGDEHALTAESLKNLGTLLKIQGI